MQQYLDLMKKVIEEGHDHQDRTEVGRRSIFSHEIRFDMNDGFPLVTTRQIFTKTLIRELLWFISGEHNISPLKEEGVSIWNKWAVTEEDVNSFIEKYSAINPEIEAAKDGVRDYLLGKIDSVGPMYGTAWRFVKRNEIHGLWPDVDADDIAKDKLAIYEEDYEALMKEIRNNEKAFEGKQIPTKEEFIKQNYYSHIDQLNELIIGLRERPYSSRHVVNAWDPVNIPFEHLSPQENVLLERSALAPCHMSFQCFVTPPKDFGYKKRLSLKVIIRSSDVPIGLPYNIAQYALLLHMLASISDMEAHELIYSGGDIHLYSNQIELAKQQLSRVPLPLSKVWINPDIHSIFDFKEEDIRIDDYNYHERIDYPVTV